LKDNQTREKLRPGGATYVSDQFKEASRIADSRLLGRNGKIDEEKVRRGGEGTNSGSCIEIWTERGSVRMGGRHFTVWGGRTKQKK